MTRSAWPTDVIMGYITGLADAANIYNAGHLPSRLLYALLVGRFSLSAEEATDAIRVWGEIRQPDLPEVDEEGA